MSYTDHGPAEVTIDLTKIVTQAEGWANTRAEEVASCLRNLAQADGPHWRGTVASRLADQIDPPPPTTNEPRTVIYGASDDLIEIVGTHEDELQHYSDQPATLLVTDPDTGATVATITVTYDDDWALEVTDADIGLGIEHIAARGEIAPTDDDGCPGYSEKIVLAGTYKVEKVLR